MIKTLKIAAVLGFAMAAQSISSQAVTLEFTTPSGPYSPYEESGFSIDVARIVDGNCAGDVAACMAFNKVRKNDPTPSSILTLIGGGVFTLSSFWGKALGQPSEVTVNSYLNGSFVETFTALLDHNVGTTFSHVFANVDAIEFLNSGNGNTRIDDVNVSAVPLPAGLPLLVSGLLGLGLLKRRRDKAQP